MTGIRINPRLFKAGWARPCSYCEGMVSPRDRGHHVERWEEDGSCSFRWTCSRECAEALASRAAWAERCAYCQEYAAEGSTGPLVEHITGSVRRFRWTCSQECAKALAARLELEPDAPK